ncbi:unnamed protein product [Arabidopsis thaliana]|uniref:(thale cress) hypothetical protein n=1 Tax=Arabidopsis thaliana TaxID=3702 RepID=A0A7G2DR26_ARATH|nr:unnamed protein product [Arabidopsis thaliana]
MKTAELIFVPLPETGHLLSTIEFGKRLLNLDRRISMITILSMNLPYAPHADASLASLTASEPGIRIISLPEIHDPPPIKLLDTSSETYILDFIHKNIPCLRKTIQDLVSSSSSSGGGSSHVAGLILDFFCVGLIDIGREVNLPSYIFMTSNFGFLGVLQYLPERQRLTPSEFDESSGEEELHIPAFVNRVPAKVLPPGVFDKLSYGSLVKIGERLHEAKGILVNSFTQVEPYAAEHFSQGRDYPHVVTLEIVSADEIATAVRSLMDSDNPVRKKVIEKSSVARKAVGDGGSSTVATCNFIKDILGDHF